MLHHFSVRHEGKYQDKATFSKFSGDGKYLISGAADACLKLVNVGIAVLSGQALKEKYRRTYYGHFGTVTDASFHPYAHVVASCSKDSTIRLYSTQPKDVVPRDMLETFDLATSLTSVAWNPCGTILAASSGNDSQIRLLDINKYERGAGIPITNPISGASSISAVGFNSQLVSASLMWATYGGGIVFYDIRSGKTLADLHGGGRAAAQGYPLRGRGETYPHTSSGTGIATYFLRTIHVSCMTSETHLGRSVCSQILGNAQRPCGMTPSLLGLMPNSVQRPSGASSADQDRQRS